ncbi:MAG: flagellar biosynthesis protein FlhB [Rhodospirillaceae bacterium]|nr:flagellar biosynthesis protein FlhB [Rhodospirillaceae bacterium]MBT5566107.1 flagellar biosynthesis protein FlhB [Rhodospirillaceae bacterium]MBT6090636.1 flagellar biosynthesis protein FlhB [Rhodospirillaceae bacterium]MBT7450421.1 flagellar biosynthesis protein FlhB [Rhodospirillaceae bacterium]
MSDDKDSKTEDPTAKRQGKARTDGDVPQSQEIKSFAMLLAGLIVMSTLAPGIASDLAEYLKVFLGRPHTIVLGNEGLRVLVKEVALEVATILAFAMGIFVFAALTAGIAVNGFLWTPKKMEPKLSTISPIAGVKRFVSVQTLVEAIKGVLKMIIVAVMVAFLVIPLFRHPDQLVDRDLSLTLSEIHWLIVLVLTLVVLVMSIIAMADLAFQRWQHNEKLKMTKQEVKDEHKEQEGDPKVKSRIRALRMERHRQRMMAAVPGASVVITNPTHYAIALTYDMDDMHAPILVAKGVDYLARRIRQIAEDNDVPLVENPPLARALYASCEVDQEIPPEHYKAVAEIIGYVMQVNGQGQVAN